MEEIYPKRPVLSMITICRNAESTIRQTLSSVLSQKAPGVEYIVVDGASKDQTLSIIREYSAQIDLVISEPDSGIYDAINKGIVASRGLAVGLIHAGDYLLPGVLQVLIPTLEKNPEAIVYGAIRTSIGGKFMGCYGVAADDLPRRMIAHPGAFVPRSVYEQLGMYDVSYKVAADYKAFLSFFLAGVLFVWIDIVVADFDLGGVSSSTEVTSAETDRARAECGLMPSLQRSGFAEFKHRVGVAKDAFFAIFR